MKSKTFGLMCLIGAVLAMLSMPASAQVTRESGTKSVAGVLHSSYNTQDSFGFFSQGGEILFADVDSDIFQMHGRMGGTHDDTSHTDTHTDEGGPPEEPGPGEHEDHEEGDGCADSGGPGGLCLQVYDRAMGEVICHAGRPMRPGWQRDPALVCPLPKRRGNSEYILSVKLSGCGSYTPPEAAVSFNVNDASATPYVLNFSLRGMASDGHLEAQAAKSGF